MEDCKQVCGWREGHRQHFFSVTDTNLKGAYRGRDSFLPWLTTLDGVYKEGEAEFLS